MSFLSQQSFSAGELSKSLLGRSDLAKFDVAAETMLNTISHVEGGASNRAGSYFVAEVRDSTKVHRLIPFIFNQDTRFALEFGNQTLRFVTEASGVIGIVTQNLVEAATYKWTASGSGTDEYYLELLAGGDPGIMQTYSIYANSLALIEGTVGSLAASEWVWDDNDTLGYDTVYVRLADGTDPDSKADGYVYTAIELPSPYISADLKGLNSYPQSADVLYLFHPEYPPYKLSRFSNTSWTLAEVEFVDGPYRAVAAGDSDITLDPAARVGSDVAVVASAALFEAKHVGSPLRFGYANILDATDIQWGYGIIDQVTNTTNARMDIVTSLGYEYMFNPTFTSRIDGWEDASAAGGVVGYNSTQQALHLKFTSGIAEARNEMALVGSVGYTISVNISTIDTTLDVSVGTTAGGAEIKGPISHTTVGVKTLNFTATQAEIHITLEIPAGVGDVDVTEVSVVGLRDDTADWRIGAFNDTDGYPRAGGFYEQRLVMAGTLAYPLTRWVSQTGKFETFSFNSPIEASDAFSFRSDSGQVNDTQWIVPLTRLFTGTIGAVWRTQGYADEALSPTSIDNVTQLFTGCAAATPLTIGNTILFLERGSGSVKEFDFSVDGYEDFDRSVLAKHLFKNHTISEWTYALLPDSIVWAIRDDGVLLGMTYLKEQDIWGWHRHTTKGTYESTCSTPGDTEDIVYTIVNRTINGATKRYIEYFKPRITDEDTYNYFFVDSGLTYSGVAATVITGLGHLEGETVVALADGNVVKDLTIVGGSITLPIAATLAHIGLGYVSDLGLFGVNLTDQQGTTQSKLRTIPSVSILFEKSRGVWSGPDAEHLDEIKFREQGMGEDPIPLFTGRKELTFNSGYDTDGKVFIRNTDPIPMTILAVTPTVEVSDR